MTVESNWQKELATAFTDPEQLLKFLGLAPEKFSQDIQARRLFPMRVPRHFARLMQSGNPHDPLLQQVLPSVKEFDSPPGYSLDPLEEQDTNTPGLLHKYKSRVLLIVRGGCAVNCRYCFRRHFPYSDNAPNSREWDKVLDNIQADPNINEVIFSGGDPLMAKDSHLAKLAMKISEIGHIRRLRIHTRLPVVMPNRIDAEFIHWFTSLPLQRILVLHVNHANEVSEELKDKLKPLRRAGVTILNQAVLLKGINDTVSDQVSLSESLFDAGILPYYLHVLDKVQGAAHFDRDAGFAAQLMRDVIGELPGFLVPKLVREVGGKTSKSMLDLHMLEE